jgi:hypothetical protein
VLGSIYSTCRGCLLREGVASSWNKGGDEKGRVFVAVVGTQTRDEKAEPFCMSHNYVTTNTAFAFLLYILDGGEVTHCLASLSPLLHNGHTQKYISGD